MTPQLLQPVRAVFASEDNPTKIGLFLGVKRITGVMNRGTYWKLLNADGSTSLFEPVTSAVPLYDVDELPDADEWLDCVYSGFMKKVSLNRCKRFICIARALLDSDLNKEVSVDE